MDIVASRYANALLELAIENNTVSDYQKQIKFVYSVIKENPNLIDFLKCYTVENLDKKKLIEKIFKSEVNKDVLHFMFLLIDKKRINYIDKICLEFNSVCNEHRGVLEGVIYTTEALSDEQIKKIEDKIAIKLNKKVELTNSINPSIIGGIKIVVNDTVFDNSVASRLNALKQELINGKDAR